MPLEINTVDLEAGEWIDEEIEKDTIFLHHTAGGHRPDWVVHGWNTDRRKDGGRKRIATTYLIGGRSTTSDDTDWDGKVVRCFPETGWAYHLGVKGTGGRLDKKSIGIEICSYGWLKPSTDGQFYSYVDKPVPLDQVEELDEPFRGYRFYHRYTEAQIEATRLLVEQIAAEHGIDLRAGLQERFAVAGESPPADLTTLELQQWLNQRGYTDMDGKPLVEDGVTGSRTRYARESVDRHPFDFNAAAKAGAGGLWTHTNVRRDKRDCSPQRLLVEMIAAL